MRIPEEYQRLSRNPEEPVNLVSYGIEKGSATALVRMVPLQNGENHIPFGKPQEVLDGIRHSMTDGQGLIEVNAGQAQSGKRFICNIVKTGFEPSGVQYIYYAN